MKEDNDQRTGAETVAWNLSDVYPEPAGQRIDSEMAVLDQDVDSFAARYRGRVAALDAEEMGRLLESYEALAERMGRAASYAHLSWATQSDDPAEGPFSRSRWRPSPVCRSAWCS